MDLEQEALADLKQQLAEATTRLNGLNNASVDELEALLDLQTKRLKELQEIIVNAEKVVKDSTREYQKLSERYGAIGDTKNRIARAKQCLIDDKLPRPVYTKDASNREDYRVAKVTPKLLHLKRVGESHIAAQIRLDSTNHFEQTYYGLDIEATLKRVKEHQESN